MIDLYCERLLSTFWAEPINAFTNISFLIAAFVLWRSARRMESAQVPSGFSLLILLSITIGLGSFLFHTFATTWARWLDILPILLFQLVFMWLYATRIIEVRRVYVALFLIVYLGIAIWARQFYAVLNGSLIYSPALIALLAMGVWHYLHQVKPRFLLLSAAGVLLLSLTFRTLDSALCDIFPTGTHFLWHLSTGLLIYLLGYAILTCNRESRSA